MQRTLPRPPAKAIALNRTQEVLHLMLKALLFAALALVGTGALTGCNMSAEQKAAFAVSHISGKLDLNEAQEAELKKMADLAIVDFKSMRTERKLMAVEAQKQVGADKADITELKRLINVQNTKRQELTDKWLTKIAEFHSKLSPEQKQKAVALMNKYTKKFTDRIYDDSRE